MEEGDVSKRNTGASDAYKPPLLKRVMWHIHIVVLLLPVFAFSFILFQSVGFLTAVFGAPSWYFLAPVIIGGLAAIVTLVVVWDILRAQFRKKLKFSLSVVTYVLFLGVVIGGVYLYLLPHLVNNILVPDDNLNSCERVSWVPGRDWKEDCYTAKFTYPYDQYVCEKVKDAFWRRECYTKFYDIDRDKLAYCENIDNPDGRKKCFNKLSKRMCSALYQSGIAPDKLSCGQDQKAKQLRQDCQSEKDYGQCIRSTAVNENITLLCPNDVCSSELAQKMCSLTKEHNVTTNCDADLMMEKHIINELDQDVFVNEIKKEFSLERSEFSNCGDLDESKNVRCYSKISESLCEEALLRGETINCLTESPEELFSASCKGGDGREAFRACLREVAIDNMNNRLCAYDDLACMEEVTSNLCQVVSKYTDDGTCDNEYWLDATTFDD